MKTREGTIKPGCYLATIDGASRTLLVGGGDAQYLDDAGNFIGARKVLKHLPDLRTAHVLDDDALADLPVGHVACPVCHVEIPVTAGEGSLRMRETGDGQSAWAEVDLTDVWAHAWECYGGTEGGAS